MDFVKNYMRAVRNSIAAINSRDIDIMASLIAAVRQEDGTLFVVGNGGGAAHAVHACCDFRNLCGLRCMTPWDNVAEMTANINDSPDGWYECYANWMSSHADNPKSCGLLVLSVGGGDRTRNVSLNLVRAIDFATDNGLSILSIVGRDGGYAAKHSTCYIVIPSELSLMTPVVESVQCALLHALAVHPALTMNKPKWEQTTT